MNRERIRGTLRTLLGLNLILLAGVGGMLLPLKGRAPRIAGETAARPASQASPPADPWLISQTVQPADLLREITEGTGDAKPIVVCVGFRPLYDGAHIPGASYHGPGRTADGLDDLKRWAQSLPRSANVVAYCGCCPLSHCPNLRPAFVALRDMGFTRLRVLLLPNDLYTDWIQKGYPTEKGK